ncbi:MAG: class I SAM-dependent methyltransferase [Gammaproteobacteria bacterium]|nr:class I SAM-dependent methyltransferase [Gammaproteobacteria bacterium]
MAEHDIPSPRLEKTFHDLLQVVKPSQIVEFGSWEGRSCVAFLKFAQELGLHTKILCVDTWLGSVEHWTKRKTNSEWSFDHLRLENGEPQIIKTFRRTIEHYGYSQQVSILRSPTANVADYLSEHFASADLMYIDASHLFFDVFRDIRLAEENFDQITISGDDFSWPQVKFAVMLSASILKFRLLVGSNGNTWVLLRRDEVERMKHLAKLGWRRVHFREIFKLVLKSRRWRSE